MLAGVRRKKRRKKERRKEKERKRRKKRRIEKNERGGKKFELGWVARRCWHSTGHGQINPDHVTLGVGVLAGPRNNRIARSV